MIIIPRGVYFVPGRFSFSEFPRVKILSRKTIFNDSRKAFTFSTLMNTLKDKQKSQVDKQLNGFEAMRKKKAGKEDYKGKGR